MVIRNNNLYNSPHCALGAGTSADMLITKNKIYNNAKWTGDMGAIYWNTNAGLFGREISYNYFENNASSYANGWAQSVFWDDIATGPWVHHNVFNKGTWATSEGGSKMALKSYGGSFALVENNIFVDTPYGAQFQTLEERRCADFRPEKCRKIQGYPVGRILRCIQHRFLQQKHEGP